MWLVSAENVWWVFGDSEMGSMWLVSVENVWWVFGQSEVSTGECWEPVLNLQWVYSDWLVIVRKKYWVTQSNYDQGLITTIVSQHIVAPQWCDNRRREVTNCFNSTLTVIKPRYPIIAGPSHIVWGCSTHLVCCFRAHTSWQTVCAHMLYFFPSGRLC